MLRRGGKERQHLQDRRGYLGGRIAYSQKVKHPFFFGEGVSPSSKTYEGSHSNRKGGLRSTARENTLRETIIYAAARENHGKRETPPVASGRGRGETTKPTGRIPEQPALYFTKLLDEGKERRNIQKGGDKEREGRKGDR